MSNTRAAAVGGTALDAGITSYLTDHGWHLLLDTIGEAQRTSKRHFVRVFFLNFTPLTAAERSLLASICIHHLTNGVHVGLVDDRALPAHLRDKRNVAWMGGHSLLHATDQISWDLEFSANRQVIADTQDKYNEFLDNCIYMFRPADVHKVYGVLEGIFKGDL